MTRIITAPLRPPQTATTEALARRIALLAKAAIRWQRPPLPIGAARPAPAAPIEDSVQPDFLICLETGMQVTLLRRHLQQLGLSFEEYRRKWGLAPDYPSAAPNYLAARAKVRELALAKDDRQESVNDENRF